ncbi:MAG: hypothetical protein QQM50_01755 [Dehalococcoides mccartyi]|uniref:hypothetical protein n=1 Tax=Dehalococcoides TaxID=61434 RepID=UPI002737845E|nr:MULTISPECIES: hypothetical protein [Dehalococcoides]MDP4279263.1 hypothetical protein [Dehalococcoides mccartyi]
MQLTFEYVDVVGSGISPDFIQFPKTEMELFYLNTEDLYGIASERIHGIYDSPVWLETNKTSSDTTIKQVELNILQGFGIVGSYYTDDAQKMLIYEFAFEMERYLEGGTIKHSMDTPITTFTLSLDNPLNENPEYEGNVAISEESSLLSPGSKIEFDLIMGNSEPYPMGVFYVDRSNFSLLSKSVSVDGRNIIGKALGDQSFDEENIYPYQLLHLALKDILYKANISTDEMLVQNTTLSAGYQFDYEMSYIEGIQEILKALDNWQIKELVDGTVVIGAASYAGFTSNSTYTFYRNKDIFTRNIVRDDQESYRRVCVHNQDFSIKVYQDVETYTGWNLQANKTLYINVPEGTSLSDAESYAAQIADSLQFVGKIESFTGPFRPQLILGDEAVIVDSEGSTILGLITEITHRFGKDGFYTDFTVDSGGKLGKGRLSDYIGRITKDKSSSSRVYE